MNQWDVFVSHMSLCMSVCYYIGIKVLWGRKEKKKKHLFKQNDETYDFYMLSPN